MKTLIVTALSWLLLLPALPSLASGGEDSGLYIPPVRTMETDVEVLRRGYQTFLSTCLSCHSIGLMRYARIADDLGWEPGEMQEAGLIPANAKITDNIVTALPADGALATYGIVPPDLSLKARELGPQWIHSFLSYFYQDTESKTGFNNFIAPGTAMPNLLAGKQGLQKPIYDDHKKVIGVELASAGQLNAKQFHEEVRDLVSFLAYVAEPAVLKRHTLGWYVIAFLLLLLVLSYLLKREYWRDIH